MGIFKSFTRAFKRERAVPDLAKWLGESENDLRAWLTNSSPSVRGYEYNTFTVPKRRGGARTIEAPNDKLRTLQRKVLNKLVNHLPAHPAATGFVRKRSIVDNARPHAQRAVVINLDLADFFPSITAERVMQVFHSRGWDNDCATILARLCTSDGHLPQGAPTSPALSNQVCRHLDIRLSKLAAKLKGQYTRYADDITLSLPGYGTNKPLHKKPKGAARLARKEKPIPRTLIRTIEEIINAEGFKIQKKKKIRVQRRYHRQTATGLVVNAGVNLPRATRRLIRAMQHHDKLGKLDEKGKKRLRGLEAFAAMVKKQR